MYYPVQKDPRGGHNRVRVNQNFFQHWSPVMAYVLGYIFADGAIEDVRKSSRVCYLAMASIDLSLIEQIRSALSSEHKIYVRKPTAVTFPSGKTYLSKPAFYLRIGSKQIYNDLLTLGVTPRKSLNCSFPFVPKKCLSFFIRGFFDGDGSIFLRDGRYPLVVFTAGGIVFLEKLRDILELELSIPFKKVNTARTGSSIYYQLRYSNRSSRTILRFMYRNLSQAPYLERKFSLYRKALSLKKGL